MFGIRIIQNGTLSLLIKFSTWSKSHLKKIESTHPVVISGCLCVSVLFQFFVNNDVLFYEIFQHNSENAFSTHSWSLAECYLRQEMDWAIRLLVSG